MLIRCDELYKNFHPKFSPQPDNELIALEIIHRYVEVLDKYFGNACELDIIFNFEKAQYILDEVVLGGELQVNLCVCTCTFECI